MSRPIQLGGVVAQMVLLVCGLAVLGMLFSGCEGDDKTFIIAEDPSTPEGSIPPEDRELDRTDSPPGVVVTIEELGGATGANGAFQVGDTITVIFSLLKDDDSPWSIDEMDRARALVSGPTFNYQRVIEEDRNADESTVSLGNGRYEYTFQVPIPAVYAAPYNDTPAFGPGDGEMTGQPLLSGTYTVAIYFAWNYDFDGDNLRDVGNATMDFLLGSATVLEPREVVTRAHCNQCHESLRFHGTLRRETRLCVLCHTSGAEDDSGEGVTIDFRVMIHKIHNGEHLPSVNGVATNPDGSRNYLATPKPYEVGGRDYSHLGFPVWPNLNLPMPRDLGYSDLPDEAQDQEDEIRTGVTYCAKCHGDPDGEGGIEPPAQGQLVLSQPSRRACGACHDDINWTQPYTSNSQTMPPQNDDSACILCHEMTGSSLAVMDAHRHPLRNPSVAPGVNFALKSVTEAGLNDGDGTIDPGEKIALTLMVTDNSGAPIDASTLSSISTTVGGPTTNKNILLDTSIPTAAFTGAQPYAINVPERIQLEFVGNSTAGLGDVFTSQRTPHWNVEDAETRVMTAQAAEASSSLATVAPIAQNFIDLQDASGFARNEFVAIDVGTPNEEYLRIQFVEGNRVWFSSPRTSAYKAGTVFDHAPGSMVQCVTLTELAEGVDYQIDPAMGMITEATEFGDGAAVVVTYTTDFVLPTIYGISQNDSPDLDETSGEWTRKSLVDGTYTVTVWGSGSASVNVFGEVTTYRDTSLSANMNFLGGSAQELEPYTIISSGDNCLACHQDMYFHGGGRRGFDTCISCHGNAGAEDRPRYVAANAPDTTEVTINFREMLHRIHMGEDLTNASTYTVVGFGRNYPNNFSEHTYEHVEFPAMPGGVRQCQKCHGQGSTTFTEPQPRDHPTEQDRPARVWRIVCGSCHDSDAALAHIDGQTSSSGAESCTVCHGTGREWAVELVHKTF